MAQHARSYSGKVVPLLEESVQDLYENAPCGYISMLPDGTIVKSNQTFLTWTGYTREELIGVRRFQELLTIPGRIYYETHFAPLLRMQGSIQEVALDMVCGDGHSLPILVNSSLKNDDAGQPVLIRTTLINASDRRMYEQELLLARRKADQMAQARADLLAMISHDIRNPLSAIVSGLAVLDRTQPTEMQQKYLRMIKSSTTHLVNLVSNVLDLSRIEAGAASLEAREFDLRALLESTFDGLRAGADGKGLRLELEIDARMPARLIGDPVKLGQVVANLLSNAVKFTERGQVVLAVQVVELLPEAVTLAFQVSDTGIGIAPEQLSHIFDEYSQASYDIGMRYGGSGLGLAICRKLVELFGSKMKVESIPGEGSSFSFVLTLRVGPPD